MMAESRKVVRSEALKNKSKLQLKQANAKAQARRLQHMTNQAKPRVEPPTEEKKQPNMTCSHAIVRSGRY